MQKPSINQIFSIESEARFNEAALQVFRYQALNCDIYKKFLNSLNNEADAISSVYDIPFLPIEFFKSQAIIALQSVPEITFTSSGTTGVVTSRHFVADVTWYEHSFKNAFELFYGDIKNYCVLALLPSYLEREGSSLVYMANHFVKLSNHADSGFYLYNHNDLYLQLLKQQQLKTPTLLLGVTFALLDFADNFKINFPELIVMETGGMKGRRKEMIREELHNILTGAFGVEHIHSEYGMTELLSQAYSKGNGIFNCPPWMKIILRDTNDPLKSFKTPQRSGGINIIDLANINSCSFIATQDLGKLYINGSFEVLGRFDNADIRGCNLLVG